MNRKASPRAGEQKRGTERVLLRIPIEVKGKGDNGKPFKEKTFTLVINRNGARISLKNPPLRDARVTITNLQNEMCCPFRVVGRTGRSLGEGPECGVECLEPEVNFWGISFPQKVAAPAEEEPIDALLECSECHFRELAQLTLEQYRGLVTQLSLTRVCAHCAAMTEWKFSFMEAEPYGAAAAQPIQTTLTSLPGKAAERRRAKRLTAKVPARIRRRDHQEEVARTENLSKTGVCFISNLEMTEDNRVLLTVGYVAGSNEVKIPARVVWRRVLEGMNKAVYGVHLDDKY